MVLEKKSTAYRDSYKTIRMLSLKMVLNLDFRIYFEFYTVVWINGSLEHSLTTLFP